MSRGSNGSAQDKYYARALNAGFTGSKARKEAERRRAQAETSSSRQPTAAARGGETRSKPRSRALVPYVDRAPRSSNVARVPVLAAALQAQFGGMLGSSVAPTTNLQAGYPPSIPVRTYAQTIITVPAGEAALVCLQPFHTAPIAVFHAKPTAAAGSYNLYFSGQAVHGASWTEGTGDSERGCTSYGNIGGFNAFTAGGHGVEGTIYNFKGGSMSIQAATSYDATAVITASGTDELPRVHGRRAVREDALLSDGQTHGTNLLRRFQGAQTFNEYHLNAESQILGGSSKLVSYLPFPSCHEGWWEQFDVADGETNSAGLLVGHGGRIMGYGSPAYTVKNTSSSGSVTLLVECALDYAIAVDSVNALIHAATRHVRNPDPVTQTMGGFAAHGPNLRQAIQGSTERAIEYSAREGTILPGEAQALMKVSKSVSGPKRENGVHKQENDEGFLSSVGKAILDFATPIAKEIGSALASSGAEAVMAAIAA